MKWLFKPRFTILDLVGIAILSSFKHGFWFGVLFYFIWFFISSLITNKFFHEPLPRS